MGKPTINVQFLHSYVKLPEGICNIELPPVGEPKLNTSNSKQRVPRGHSI